MKDDLDTDEVATVSFDEFVDLMDAHKAFHEQASSQGHGHSPKHGTGIRKDDNGH